MEPNATAAPPSALPDAAHLPHPPESVAAEPPKGGRTDLFVKRPARTRWVTLPTDGKQYLVAAVKPGQMAWVSNQCFIRKPDPDDPEKEKVDWDSTRRGFYMVAIALREPDGKRMYPGSLEDPSQWIYGAEKVMDLENEEYEVLFTATNELSGFVKGAQEAAGKGSGKTPSTG